jgi:hypothetical protein
MRTRIVTILVVLAAATAAHAQVQQMRQYAAKFVCGKSLDQLNFAPGTYYPTINVHNPARLASIEFRKKFARAEINEKAGTISPWFGAGLKADEALQIDCRNIYGHTNTIPGSFIEGFVVIELPPNRELDVVGVYTAAGNAGVSTMHMERVAGRITQ